LRLEELLGSLRLALDRLQRAHDESNGVQRGMDLGGSSLEELLHAVDMDGEDPQLLPVVSRLGRRR